MGDSGGYPYKSFDMVEDGTIALQHMVDEFHVEYNDIILHGWSIGGAVASQINCPDCLVINDRSFSRLSRLLRGIDADLSFSVAAGSSIWMAASFVLFGWSRIPILSAGVVGTGFSMISGNLIIFPLLLNILEWRMDPVEHIKARSNGARHNIIIYHEQDGLIDYKQASMKMGLEELKLLDRDDISVFKLPKDTKHGLLNHMAKLNTEGMNFKKLKKLVKSL